MPSITFERFEFGLDVRKGKSASDANRLRVLTNAHVSSGRQIKKRATLTPFAALTAGTVGLVAGKGKLQTFYGGTGSISHAEPLILATRTMHPITPALTVTNVLWADVYDGYMYVITEYSDGSVWHHWVNDPGSWVTLTAYALGAYRRPTVANGFIYEVTANGTTAAGEPAWPTTPGLTVVDGTVTWTCRSYAILDTNNPRSRHAAKLSDRIFAIGDEIVAFHAQGNPRDWTTTSDAGFLPVGLRATGNTDPTALGVFQDQLSVMFNDAIQLWQIDADPELMALRQIVPNIGTTYPNSLLTVGQDLFFLAQPGFRSIGLITDTGNFQDADVGSPIDTLVKAERPFTEDPIAVWYSAGGQAWWIFGDYAWVYTFSRVGKITAWSRYEFPVTIEAAAILVGELYLRASDTVYTLDESRYDDDGTVPTVTVELPYLSLGSPGVLKQIIGVDVVIEGTASLQFRFDPNNEALITGAVQLTGDTRAYGMVPVEMMATAIAPVFVHAASEPFELHSMTVYYEILGPIR